MQFVQWSSDMHSQQFGWHPDVYSPFTIFIKMMIVTLNLSSIFNYQYFKNYNHQVKFAWKSISLLFFNMHLEISMMLFLHFIKRTILKGKAFIKFKFFCSCWRFSWHNVALCEFRRKVRDIFIIGEHWNKWGFQGAILQTIPINIFKPRVSFYFLCSLCWTDSFCWVLLK